MTDSEWMIFVLVQTFLGIAVGWFLHLKTCQKRIVDLENKLYDSEQAYIQLENKSHG